MLVHNHHTDRLMTPQSLSRGGEAWTTEVVPRLPAHLAEQARELKAFPRVRGIATPHDLWRGLRADGLGPLSTRRLGAWAVLSGLADLAAAAWRKRLRARNDWRLWLVGALRAVSEAPAPSVPQLAGGLLVVEARGLRHPGGPGDDWRLHRAYDRRAGRRHQGGGTDRRGGHTWRGSSGQPAR